MRFAFSKNLSVENSGVSQMCIKNCSAHLTSEGYSEFRLHSFCILIKDLFHMNGEVGIGQSFKNIPVILF